jgi:hypothetical protein
MPAKLAANRRTTAPHDAPWHFRCDAACTKSTSKPNPMPQHHALDLQRVQICGKASDLLGCSRDRLFPIEILLIDTVIFPKGIFIAAVNTLFGRSAFAGRDPARERRELGS